MPQMYSQPQLLRVELQHTLLFAKFSLILSVIPVQPLFTIPHVSWALANCDALQHKLYVQYILNEPILQSVR